MNWKVYIIHFNEPYKHARHYIGITNNLLARMKKHIKGNGANLIRVILNSAIGFRVNVIKDNLTYKEAREMERKLKRQKNSIRYCTICKKELL